MSFDYSFQKGQMWLLGALCVLMAALLVTTGFLIGRITMTPPDTAVAGSTGVIAAPGTVISPAPQPAARSAGGTGVSVALPQMGGGYVATPSRVVVPLGGAGSGAAAAAPVTAAPASGDLSVVVSSSGAATSGSAADMYTLGSPGYTLQYGAFRDPANARELMKQLSEQKVIASLVTMTSGYGETYSVVRSGAYPTVADARGAAVEQANKLRMPIVVRPAGRL